MLKDAPNRYFHITPKRNLETILIDGLIPQIGERSSEIGESVEAIFLFPNFQEMNNALCNWLGEEFEEDEELIILQIDLPQNFPVYREVDDNGNDFYEAHCQCDISEEYITGIYDESYTPLSRYEIFHEFDKDDKEGL